MELTTKILLALIGAVSTVLNGYLGYKLKKKDSQVELQKEKVKQETRTDLKMNEQSQDMLKFWVKEFNKLKEQWEDRRDSMDSQIDEYEDKVSSLQEELHRTEGRLDKLEEVIENKDKKISDFKEKLEQKEETISYLKKEINKRDEKIEEMEGRIDSLSETVNGRNYDEH